MLDILTIRDALNQLPFRDGKRQVHIGRISESIPLPPLDEDQDEQPPTVVDSPLVSAYLQRIEAELAKYDLELMRDVEDRDSLFAVQRLRHQSHVDLSWLSEAYAWSGRIVTVALEMVLPGILGMWLDRRAGTGFIGLIGFALGVSFGIWHLLQMTKKRTRQYN